MSPSEPLIKQHRISCCRCGCITLSLILLSALGCVIITACILSFVFVATYNDQIQGQITQITPFQANITMPDSHQYQCPTLQCGLFKAPICVYQNWHSTRLLPGDIIDIYHLTYPDSDGVPICSTFKHNYQWIITIGIFCGMLGTVLAIAPWFAVSNLCQMRYQPISRDDHEDVEGYNRNPSHTNML